MTTQNTASQPHPFPIPRRSPYLPDPADQILLTSFKTTKSHSTPKKPLGTGSLLSPTTDLTKPGSLHPSSKTSASDSLTSDQQPDRAESESKEGQLKGENGDNATIKSKTSHDPLSAQVLQLFSLAKDSAPSGQRLENLTWRMMAMAIHRKDSKSQRRLSFSESAPPETTNTTTATRTTTSAASGTVASQVSPSPADTAHGQAALDSQTNVESDGSWFPNDHDMKESEPAMDVLMVPTMQIDSELTQIVPGADSDPVGSTDTLSEQPRVQQESLMMLDDILPTLPTMADTALFQLQQDSQIYGVASPSSSGTPFASQASSIPATLTHDGFHNLLEPYTLTSATQQQQRKQQQEQQEQWLLQAMTDISALDPTIGNTGGQKSTALNTNIDQLSPVLSLEWQQGQQQQQKRQPSFGPLELAFADHVLTQASTSVSTVQVPADVPPWPKEDSEWWQDPSLTDTIGKLPYETLSSLFDLQQPQDFRVPLSSTSSDSDTEDEDFVPIMTAKTTVAASVTKDSTSTPPPTQCNHCETKTTPLWRRDQDGNTLCNACGLFLKLHGRARPLSLKTDVIRKRNRVGLNSKSTGSTATDTTGGTAVTAKPKLRNDRNKEKETITESDHGTKRCHRENRDHDRYDAEDPSRSGNIAEALPSSALPTASVQHQRGPAIGYFSPPSPSKRQRRHSGTGDMNVHSVGPNGVRKEHLKPRGSISLSTGSSSPEEISAMTNAPLSAPMNPPSLLLPSGSSASSFAPNHHNSELYRTLQEYLNRQQQEQYQLAAYLSQQQEQRQQQRQQQLGQIQEPTSWMASLLFPMHQQLSTMTTTNISSNIAAPLSDHDAEAAILGSFSSVDPIATHSFLDTHPQTPLESQLDQLGVSMDIFNDLLGQQQQ